MRELRQSTAFTHKAGPFVDDTGAAVTTLDIDRADVKLAKNGGALTQKNDTTANAAHDADGYYLITCDATDSDTLGHLRMTITEVGALLHKEDFMVLSAVEWDRKYTALGQGLAGVIGYGTAQSASGTGVVLAAADAFADDVLIGATIFVFGSTQGYWQSREITDNALSGDAVSVDAWTVTPSGTISYVILAGSPGSATSPPPVNVTKVENTDATDYFAALDDAVLAAIATLQTDTDNIQTRIPAALTANGNMKSSVLEWISTAFSEGAEGRIAAAIQQFFNIASPTSTMNLITMVSSFAGSHGIKKNTAKAAFMFAMTDSTNHLPATGLTVTATRSLDGAAFAACANAVSEVSAGWYKISLAAGDVNGDTVGLKFTASGADQLNISIVTAP